MNFIRKSDCLILRLRGLPPPTRRFLVRHHYMDTKREGGKGYQPVGVSGKPYRTERRNVARVVRRRTKQGRTISETCRIIQDAYVRAGK